MFYHIWFLTKYRAEDLIGKMEKTVKNILAECFQRHNYNVLEFETNRDHVHMLIKAGNRKDLANIIKTIKAVSAKEILATQHLHKGKIRKHFWARRYGCKEIEEREIENIREYIRSQKKIPHAEACGVTKITPHFRVGNVSHLTAKCPAVYLKTFG